MKKISKSRRFFVLVVVLVAAFFAILLLRDDEDKLRNASTETSLVAQLFNKLVGATPAIDSSVVRKQSEAQTMQQAISEQAPVKDVCEDLAKRRKTDKDWKQFDVDLRKKLDSRLPEIAKALEKIKQSQNPLEKASALYLTAQLNGAQAESAFTSNRNQCEADDACRDQMLALRDQASWASINEIAKMAIYSPDPKLYMIAFNACNSHSNSDLAYCAQINARQWASRDPSNGMAWMHVLTQLPRVESGKGSSAVDDALFRISQAKYFDGGFSILSNIQGNAAMQFDDYIAQTRLEELASDAWAHTPLPAYLQVLNSCKGKILNNPNRRQTCNEIAQKWQREDAFAIEHPLTASLGRNLEWDSSRIAKIQDEWDAISGMRILETQELEAAHASPEANACMNCRAYLKHLKDFQGMVTEGELKQYRKNLAVNSKPHEELIRILHDERAKAQTTLTENTTKQ